jgi:hypothetical protein
MPMHGQAPACALCSREHQPANGYRQAVGVQRRPRTAPVRCSRAVPHRHGRRHIHAAPARCKRHCLAGCVEVEGAAASRRSVRRAGGVRLPCVRCICDTCVGVTCAKGQRVGGTGVVTTMRHACVICECGPMLFLCGALPAGGVHLHLQKGFLICRACSPSRPFHRPSCSACSFFFFLISDVRKTLADGSRSVGSEPCQRFATTVVGTEGVYACTGLCAGRRWLQ